MNDASDTESNEEERPIFCPYNQESLLAAEARIAQAEIKKNERKKKREEGEVLPHLLSVQLHFNSFDHSSIQYFVSLFFFPTFFNGYHNKLFLANSITRWDGFQCENNVPSDGLHGVSY